LVKSIIVQFYCYFCDLADCQTGFICYYWFSNIFHQILTTTVQFPLYMYVAHAKIIAYKLK